MRSTATFTKVFLCRDHIDFRKWANGLVAIVESEMNLDPFGSYLFAFTNRRRDKIKLLYWDQTGYAVWFKSLQEHKFKWPSRGEGAVLKLTPQQLDFLLQGYDVSKMTPHQPLKYASNF